MTTLSGQAQMHDRTVARSGRALFLINGEHYAGAERVQDLLATHLPTFGWSVDFACLKTGLFESMREAKNSMVTTLSMRSRLDLGPARQVARLLQEGSYDLLHTHTVRSALIGRFAARQAAKPMVHHVHSRTDYDTENVLRNRLNSVIQWYSLRQASRLIAVSGRTADYLRGLGYPDELIRVVPNGAPSIAAQDGWQPPASSWVLGMIALFRPRKGVEILIEALAALRAAGFPVSLRAVGAFESEAYRQQVLRLAVDRGVAEHIVWPRFTRDIASELTQMNLFVLPSLYGEGLPMVLIEAMAAGLPVIATTNEGIPEVLEDGASGMLVAPNDAALLAQAIGFLIEHPDEARRLARRGQHRQRERYSEIAMARHVAMVYQELWAKGSAP